MIERLNRENLRDINRANQPFELIGRVLPEYRNKAWTYAEQLFEESSTKAYPNDPVDYAAYIDAADRAAFLYYESGECLGQIILRRDWNRYAFVEDIAVAVSARGKGVGTALMQSAVKWAKKNDLCGLALETQDTNVWACRFYRRFGMKIGGVNTMLYRQFSEPYCDEIAIFWYLEF